MSREIRDVDAWRLARGINALLEDPQAEVIDQVVAGLQSLDDLGRDLNSAAAKLRDRLMARSRTKKAGFGVR